MTTYLLTGANRGIGRALADIVLSRPNNTLIALVRNPDDATSRSLTNSESAAEGTQVITVKYEASDHNSIGAIIEELQKEHQITHLDVVIANAGYLDWRGPTATITPEAIHKHIDVNTIAPIMLFSATLPLLRQSEKEPKFFAISSAIGSTAMIPKLSHAQVVAYGMSKAAMNHAFVKLNVEHNDIDIELLTPGPVRTELLRSVAGTVAGVDPAATVPNVVDINDSVSGLMKCIDNATNAATGGGFRQWDGSTVPW